MTTITNEDTIENQEESDNTSIISTDTEVQDTSIKPGMSPSEMEEANKKLYARTKTAEANEKALKEELAELRKKLPPEETSEEPEAPKEDNKPTNVLEVAKTVAALKDFTPDELGDIDLVAKGKSLSIEEAAKTEEAKALVAARRKKVENENATAEPSGVTPGGFVKKTPEELGKMTYEERKAYAEEFSKHKESEGV